MVCKCDAQVPAASLHLQVCRASGQQSVPRERELHKHAHSPAGSTRAWAASRPASSTLGAVAGRGAAGSTAAACGGWEAGGGDAQAVTTITLNMTSSDQQPRSGW